MDLSIIIPVWNEEHKIGKDISSLIRYSETKPLTMEIIIVDDGSTDRTCEEVRSWQQRKPDRVRLLCTGAHHGKGYAVKEGILQSGGRYVMFMDCGGNVPLDFIDTGISLLQQDRCDLAHGSRHLPGSRIGRPMSVKRRVLSRLFRAMIHKYLGLPAVLTDTQCGFKLYKGDVARRLYRDITLGGFLFDPEVILLAIQDKLRIMEFPIKWSWDEDTRLNPGRILNRVLRDARYLKNRYVKR